MASPTDIAAIQTSIGNRLDPIFIGDRRIAGVIGDAPSQYSRSPALWNAAFRLLEMNAVYLPFDVEENQLKHLVSTLRSSARVLGVNVTVPHKLRIMEYLDEVDPDAARVQAVNTVVRTQNGRLIGYNTDGAGFIESILKPQAGQTNSFIESLRGMDVLLLGAGGSARAVAFHLSRLLDEGELLICNRTVEQAQSLATELHKHDYNARAVPESELSDWALRVGFIINSTTKGQAGVRRLHPNKVTTMEPYSALGPANPILVSDRQTGSPESIIKASEEDIRNNNEISMKIASSVSKDVRFYDVIYFPEETVFLSHARQTGHLTMNGKNMMINQAVIAFCKRICRAELQARGIENSETYQRVLEAMHGAW
ncbi:MAG TPA: shikimate dehydrogenase [Candidatus Udaeobacter sp.]|nr:shikimate dehydrogenase [Candidatus Udaeobacter sp.]